MEALLLGIYAFFVWLIFIKFKWLPWNTTSQVTVVVIPIVALTALILTLNVVAPSSSDVRVIKYVVQIIPQVRGRVIEVPVEPNRLVKKGELLFRIDPTPYQNDLNVAKSRLAADEAKLAQAGAGLVDASAGARQLQEQLKSASGQVSALQPKLELARLRVRQYRELVATGAGDKFALEQAEANVTELARPDRDRGRERGAGHAEAVGAGQRRAGVGRGGAGAARDGEGAGRLEPCGSRERAVEPRPDGGLRADQRLRDQRPVAAGFVHGRDAAGPGDELRRGGVSGHRALRAERTAVWSNRATTAEFTLHNYPGRVIKASVDSIVWAQGQGQVPQSGTLPQTGAYPQVPGRFPVKLLVAERDRELFLPAGAVGGGAIYTEHAQAIHILRMVILRINSIMDYLVLKLH